MHGRQFLPLALPVALMLSARGQSFEPERADAAKQLNQVGIERYKGGQFDEALSTFTKTRDLYQEKSDPKGEATALSEIAMCYAALGESQRAVEYLEKAVPEWRQAGDREDEASALGKEGDVYRTWGFPELAIRYYKQ